MLDDDDDDDDEEEEEEEEKEEEENEEYMQEHLLDRDIVGRWLQLSLAFVVSWF